MFNIYILTVALILLYSNFNVNCKLLLVVGDVTETTARILYEELDKKKVETLNVEVYNVDDLEQQIPLEITPSLSPKILKISDLKTNHKYSIYFNKVDFVTFRTIETGDSSHRSIVVSCDRSFEDNDLHTIDMIGKEKYDVQFHLGDNIYADTILPAMDTLTYEEQLEMYRNIYRTQWGDDTHQTMYRNGAHLMIPDDHEIVDNLNIHHINMSFIRAGKQVTYEYQYALYSDINDNYDNHFYFNKVVGNTAYFLIDYRFEKLFHYDPEANFIGIPQYKYFEEQFELVNNSEAIKNIVILTSIPVLYGDEFSAKVAYLFGKERYSAYPEVWKENEKLLLLIFKYYHKVKLLIGGDHHLLAKSYICHSSGKCLEQWITSGISKASTTSSEFKLTIFQYLCYYYTNIIHGFKVHKMSIDLYKNYGVLEVSDRVVKFIGVVDHDGMTLRNTLSQKFIDMYPLFSLCIILLSVLAVTITPLMLFLYYFIKNLKLEKKKDQ